MHKHSDLAELFREHELRVFTYLRRMVHDRETAADLSQETFLRAFRAAHKFRGDSSVSTWLLGIARRVYLEWVRRQARPTINLSSDESSVPPSGESVDVERALLELSPEHREVLVLRFALDLSGEDVARILDVSHAVVRQRATRAKQAFREVWAD